MNLPRPKVNLLIFISIWILTLKTFMWVLWQRNFSPFFTVPLHMSPQRTLDRAGKVTLVALVWLFSTVCFQMSPQTICPSGCKVALAAFVWFYVIFCRLHNRSFCILAIFTQVTILKIHDLKSVKGRRMKIWPRQSDVIWILTLKHTFW